MKYLMVCRKCGRIIEPSKADRCYPAGEEVVREIRCRFCGCSQRIFYGSKDIRVAIEPRKYRLLDFLHRRR